LNRLTQFKEELKGITPILVTVPPASSLSRGQMAARGLRLNFLLSPNAGQVNCWLEKYFSRGEYRVRIPRNGAQHSELMSITISNCRRSATDQFHSWES
jgi:hypothetical protein